MEDYLNNLKKMIDSKNIDQFSVFPDVKPFKIIKKGRTEIKEVIKKNPKKYAGKRVAVVSLYVKKDGLKNNKDIFSIGITVSNIDDEGNVGKYSKDNWLILIKYMPDDLENHPFKMTTVEKLVKLVDKKLILSDFGGISYKQLEEDLENIRNSITKKKKSSRTKKSSKKLIKRTSKRISKKSVKRTSKRLKKY